MDTSQFGYSGKPLYQKLGLKSGMSCLLIGAPDCYPELVAGAGEIKFRKRAAPSDVVHLFCRTKRELETNLDRALSYVNENGKFWVSWPKKSSPLHIDLVECDVRRIILPTGWVDVKVCAVDSDWSGLKFLRRRVAT